MAPKAKKSESTTQSSKSKQPPEPQTIGEKLRADYQASRPFQVLFETKGWAGLSPTEKTAYSHSRILESETYLDWTAAQQRDLLKLCEIQKIPIPLPKPRPLGTDRSGRRIEDYSLEEYKDWKKRQWELESLKNESHAFRRRASEEVGRKKAEERAELWLPKRNKRTKKDDEASAQKVEQLFDPPITEVDIQEERRRRVDIAQMQGGKMPGRYEGNPVWDDVVPIPQDDGEKPLAAIAYTDEYAEAISYLRAVMAVHEHSQRAFELTAHIIDMNPAHYTVWLYRASILKALQLDVTAEILWVNEVALANLKNYQIWHHRQLLIDTLYPTISSDRTKVLALAHSELDFMSEMFQQDSKNYHVWSYRQYLTNKLDLFPSQCSDPSELAAIERLLKEDVRNNSAWSHRFFMVFSDPGHSTEDSGPLERDEKVPKEIIDREIEFSKQQIRRAPQNQSGWNYVRGALKKGGREMASLEIFAREFVKFHGDGSTAGETQANKEDVTSSHALDFLADLWAEKGEVSKADKALELLSGKYDRIRKNYWDWRREALKEETAA